MDSKQKNGSDKNNQLETKNTGLIINLSNTLFYLFLIYIFGGFIFDLVKCNFFPDKTEASSKTLINHTGSVETVDISPDGKMIASGSRDKTVRLWIPFYDKNKKINIKTKALVGHTGSVYSVSFSHDGKYLASGSIDKSIIIWDIFRNNKFKTLNNNKNCVNAVRFSQDGKYLASGSDIDDKRIIIWNTETWEPKWVITGYEDPRDRMEIYFDNIIGKKTDFPGHTSGISSLSFSPDGKYLASGSYDNTIKFWNPGNGKLIKTLYGHSDGVKSIEFSPDGKYLASASYDQSVKIWDINSGKVINSFSFDGRYQYPRCVSFTPDSEFIAAGMNRWGKIIVWNVNTGKQVVSFEDHKDSVNSIRFSPDGLYLISGSDDKTIKFWKAKLDRF